VGWFSELGPYFEVLLVHGLGSVTCSLISGKGALQKLSLCKVSWEIDKDPTINVWGEELIELFLNLSWTLGSL
tara:strand:+ start:1135 stop:1353 length:219 start_codon:yes stop_codon:yes gene_type:complete